MAAHYGTDSTTDEPQTVTDLALVKDSNPLLKKTTGGRPAARPSKMDGPVLRSGCLVGCKGKLLRQKRMEELAQPPLPPF